MEYALLFLGDEKILNSAEVVENTNTSAEYAAYIDALMKAGVWRAGMRLRPTSATTTVRVRDKKAVVLAGPYAETQEQLGGFLLIDVPDLDAAIDWAAKCPAARDGTVEIRPIWPATGQQSA